MSYSIRDFFKTVVLGREPTSAIRADLVLQIVDREHNECRDAIDDLINSMLSGWPKRPVHNDTKNNKHS